jgi:hypothetical protein
MGGLLRRLIAATVSGFAIGMLTTAGTGDSRGAQATLGERGAGIFCGRPAHEDENARFTPVKAMDGAALAAPR